MICSILSIWMSAIGYGRVCVLSVFYMGVSIYSMVVSQGYYRLGVNLSLCMVMNEVFQVGNWGKGGGWRG